jgi:enoyl-[acyl-carrier protein] reductase I
MTEPRPLYLLTGVANEASIAWGVADSLMRRENRCLLGVLPKNVHRAQRLVKEKGYDAEIVPLDVSQEASIAALAALVAGQELAGLLHSIAYANFEDLQGTTLETSRSGFLESLDVSVYSLIALIRAVRPALRSGSSIVALSYHGSQKCMPGYNVMGIAKAALESACRYLAFELGADGIRVNCASPGALLTLSSSAFVDIQENIERGSACSPLREPTRMADVAAAICYLLSRDAGGITGQTVYVDNGISIMGG